MPRRFCARGMRRRKARHRLNLNVERLELRAMFSVAGVVDASQNVVGAETNDDPELAIPTRLVAQSEANDRSSPTGPILVPPDDAINPIAECPRLDPRLCLPQDGGPRRLRSVLHRSPHYDSSTSSPLRVPSRVVLLLPYQRSLMPTGDADAEAPVTRRPVVPPLYLTQFPGPYVP